MKSINSFGLVKTRGVDVFTTSLSVADVFRRDHDAVLCDIENLNCSPRFRERNFEAVLHSRVDYAYRITRDGFDLLTRLFTGPDDIPLIEEYVNRFSAKFWARHNAPDSVPAKYMPFTEYTTWLVSVDDVGLLEWCPAEAALRGDPVKIHGKQMFVGLGKAITWGRQQARELMPHMSKRLISWLSERVPADWPDRNLEQRMAFLHGGECYDGSMVLRGKVCAQEVWMECLGGAAVGYSGVGVGREINSVLSAIGWEPIRGYSIGCYGQCINFTRPNP